MIDEGCFVLLLFFLAYLKERKRLLREHASQLMGYLPPELERELAGINASSSPAQPSPNPNGTTPNPNGTTPQKPQVVDPVTKARQQRNTPTRLW